MGIKLYMIYGSPPVNAVLMSARALKVELELYEVDFEKSEHLADWFLEINPSHTVPTLNDDGFILWDSHAILCYLAETYGENGYLYSTNNKEKAKIYQFLNFDCGTLFRRFSDCIRPIFYEGQKTISSKTLVCLKEAYSFLERMLQSSKYLVGDQLTIADISVLSTIMPSDVILPVSKEEFPLLKAWMTLLETMDFYEAGRRGLDTFREGCKIMMRNDQ